MPAQRFSEAEAPGPRAALPTAVPIPESDCAGFEEIAQCALKNQRFLFSAEGHGCGLTVTSFRSPAPLFSFPFLSVSFFFPTPKKRLSFYPSGSLNFPLFPWVSSKGQNSGPGQGVFSGGRGQKLRLPECDEQVWLCSPCELGAQPCNRICDPPHCPGVAP